MENIKKLSNMQYEIEITLNETEVKEYLEKALTEQLKKVKEPGFRPGKMPRDMFIKKYKMESIYPNAIDLIVNDVYPKIIENNKLNVVASPNFDWTNVKINEKEFFVKGTVDVVPEFDMVDYKEIKKSIKKDEIKVTKKEIKETIDNLIAKDASYETKEDYAANSGDITVIDYEGFKEGVAFEGGKGEEHSLTLGSNTFIPGFEEQLVGSKAGEEKEVKVTFPEDYQAEDLKGKDVVFICKVKEVKKRTLPRLTETKIKEFEEYEATNKEELEKEIENKLLKQKENISIGKYEKEILEAVIKAIDLKIPESMVKEETDHTIKNIRQNFKQQGIELEMYLQMTGSNMETLLTQLNKESEERIAMQLIIGKIKEETEIEVSEKEIEEQLEKIVKDYKLTKEDALKQLGNTTEPIKRDLEFDKARKLLFK